MHELVVLRVPADIAVAIAELRSASASGEALEAAMLRGGELLEAERQGKANLRHRLRMAYGDELFHRARLVIAQHEVKQLSDEVWDLEGRVQGQRPDDPPAQLPEALPPLETVLVQPSAAVVAAVGDEGDALAFLAMLCYGLGARRGESVVDVRLGVEANRAMSSFAARKYELRNALATKEHLELRRAGLRGMLESAKLAVRARADHQRRGRA